MPQFIPAKSSFDLLRDKVVVLSGGATGIGAATARLLHQHGAKVVIGDINEKDAQSLVQEGHGKISFVRSDVTNYADIYNLFKTAHDQHNRVDHAISCAGIFEKGAWFDPKLTIDTVSSPDSAPTSVLDVNVIGSANFSRVAVVFLREDFDAKQRQTSGQDKSLVLFSSVNAFRESPGLYMYQTSKHAVHGLMRAMRKPIFERDGIRVNCICPGVTESPMTRGIVEKFQSAGLYWQSSDAVAQFVLGMLVAPEINGKAVYIEGGDGWEFEDSFIETQPQWLGEEPTRRMRVNTDAVNKGALIKD